MTVHWYAYTPQDTLFVRGAESAEMGADHSASTLFPPPPQTILGALRTAVLMHRGISPGVYIRHDFSNQEILNAIGTSDDPKPFSIKGPLFIKEGKVFIPAPASWFIEKEKQISSVTEEKNAGPVRVIKSEPLPSELFVSDEELWWATGRETVSLGGKWILADEMDREKIHVYDLSHFAVQENRTGIALSGRTVREGHLYNFQHYRLTSGTKLLFGVDRDLALPESGSLGVGGERRFGGYERRQEPVSLPEGNSCTYLLLTAIEGDEVQKEQVIATPPIRYVGGWDMKRGFHKPMKGYYPPGAVFSSRVNDNCLQI